MLELTKQLEKREISGSRHEAFTDATRKRIVDELVTIPGGHKLDWDFIVHWMRDDRYQDVALSEYLTQLLREMEIRDRLWERFRDGQRDGPARTFLAQDEDNDPGSGVEAEEAQEDGPTPSQEQVDYVADEYRYAFLMQVKKGNFQSYLLRIKEASDLPKVMCVCSDRGDEAVEVHLLNKGAVTKEEASVCWSCGSSAHWAMDCPPDTRNPALPFKPAGRDLLFDRQGLPHMFSERIESGNPRTKLSNQGYVNIRAASHHINNHRINQAALQSAKAFANAPSSRPSKGENKKTGGSSRFQRGSR